MDPSRRDFLKLCGLGLGACPFLGLGPVRDVRAADPTQPDPGALLIGRYYDPLPDARLQCHICPFD